MKLPLGSLYVCNIGSVNELVPSDMKSLPDPLLAYICLNSSPPGQNGCHFAEDIYICIFVNDKFCILMKISPKFVLKGPINNKQALV